MLEQAKSVLKSVFGFDRFISLQQDVMESVLSGRDCLAVMPTGGGKSLCYQIPALLFDGLTIVISPLISLMKDQVEQLAQLGIPSVLLNSSLSPEAYRKNVQQVRSGEAKLLYVAPETLLKPNMLAMLDSIPVSCLAIDEAHCISEWGHDFRTEYRQLAEVRSRMPHAVCIALTATATPRVRNDIKNSLRLADSSEFISSFNRENLLIRVVPKNKPLQQAAELLQKYPNDSGIIYCSTRKEVDTLCASLRVQGVSASPYHGGLSDSERSRNQERFVRDQVLIIIATVAFGMGIDKSNVRFILHYDLPKNIESYYQEIGRAGRDGLPAECVLLFSYGDIYKIQHFIKQKEGLEKRAANLQLAAMLRFSESDVCRRIALLGYFGETFENQTCGMCDNCLAGEKPTTDLTIPAQKFLSCVKRTGERFGISHIVHVLRGSKAEKVLKFRHEQLSTYGIGMELTRAQWQQLARQLLHREFMVQDPEIGSLSLTPKAWDVFRGKEAFLGRLDDSDEPEQEPKADAVGPTGSFEQELFEALRKKRKDLAESANIPPYVVFSDRTLTEMATYLPRSPESMLAIHGIGRAKLDRYGSIFLEIIQQYCREHAIETEPAVPSGRAPDRPGSTREMREIAIAQAFNSGQPVQDLARRFNIKESRVLAYLLSHRLGGGVLRPEGFLPLMRQSGHQLVTAMKAFEELGAELLRPVFDAMGREIHYDDLKILRLYYLSLHHEAQGSHQAGSARMSTRKKMVCLANSRKYSGCCIAGKELAEGGVGPWIRPVSPEATGELSWGDMVLPGGTIPKLLDIIEIPLEKALPRTHQWENHLLGEGRWTLVETWDRARLGELCDDIDRLWINGYHSFGGWNDRMPVQLAEEVITSSLAFIAPESLTLTVAQGSRGLNKVLANFTYQGEVYRIHVTDPIVEASYLPRDTGHYPVDGPQPYVTVSISEPFEGFCYKLAAALIL